MYILQSRSSHRSLPIINLADSDYIERFAWLGGEGERGMFYRGILYMRFNCR